MSRFPLITAVLLAVVAVHAFAADSMPVKPSIASAPSSDVVLRLKPLIVHDAGINNIEAFRILIPEGWKSRGGVIWMPNRSFLATTSMQIWNPDGPEGVQIYPTINYTWNTNGIYGFPPGSNYLGNIVAAPVDHAAYVSRVVLPNFRSNVSGLQLVDREPLPDVAATLARMLAEPGVNKTVNAERIRVSYTFQGQAYDEDFYCAIAYARFPHDPASTLWQVVRLYSFRAGHGQLDQHAKLLQSMAASVRINPMWYTKYLYVRQLFMNRQRQSIVDAGALSRYIARTNDEITRINQKAWEDRQKTYDHINQQFSNYVRGVDQYTDPYTHSSVELPSGYDHTWVSETGEYILTNQSGFNPNDHSTVNWQQARPADAE